MIKEIIVSENFVLVILSGGIYSETAAQLRETLIGYFIDGHNIFVIDLGNVDYIDSAGLGTLVAIHKRARQTGGNVILKDMRGLVKEIFELTQLTKVFEIQ